MAKRGIRIYSWLTAALLIGAFGAQGTAALEPDELTPSDLQGKSLLFPFMAPPAKTFGSAADGISSNGPAFGGGLPGIDSLVNFTGQFSAPGVDFNGNPQTVWYYAMVGKSPELGGVTVINAPIIPVSVALLDANGELRRVRGAPLVSSPHHLVHAVVESPIFQNYTYTSSRQPTQYTDAIQRAEFWNFLDEESEESNWHTLLSPSVKEGRVMKLPYGSYQFALKNDGRCCAFILADINIFSNLLFPPTYPVDNTTVMGAAELAGDATTKDITTLLFSDVYLYLNGDPKQCCVGGYHTFDYEPGATANALPRAYITNYSTWVTLGLFGPFQDIGVLSHELAETFNDPFVAFDNVHNTTPWWQAPGTGPCSFVMEVGDVLEGLPYPLYPITLNGYTYHPQTVALLPWFEFKKHSHAIDGAYSYPDTTLLTALSPPEKVNCK